MIIILIIHFYDCIDIDNVIDYVCSVVNLKLQWNLISDNIGIWPKIIINRSSHETYTSQ